MIEPALDSVWRIVQAMNHTWVSGDADALGRYFHPDMIIVATGMRLEGREACVESYREFCASTTIKWFSTSNPSVSVFGETAVATYEFDLTYEWDGQTIRDKGKEIFVLLQQNDSWQAVWRTVIPAPDAGAT